jgi:hypothetical protein
MLGIYIHMRCDELISKLLSKPGVVRVEVLDAETVSGVVDEEDSVRVFSGSMELESIGLGKCVCKDLVAAVFCDSSFPRPDVVTIEIVDEYGTLMAQDVPPSLKPSISKLDNVVWLSESFVLYTDSISLSKPHMVMKASPFPGPADFGTEQPWVFYPSVSTADYLNRRFDIKDSAGLSTIILGVDGVEGSPSVPDVVEVPCGGRCHREPSPEHPLYRGYLVGEALEDLQLPLADENLHALVAVEMDVDRCVDGSHVPVLDVGELVADGVQGMVVDEDDGADHPFLLVLPLVLGKRVAYEVANRFGSADVPLLAYRAVELLQQLGLQRDAYAGNSFHAPRY